MTVNEEALKAGLISRLEETLDYFRVEFPKEEGRHLGEVWQAPVDTHSGGVTPEDLEVIVEILREASKPSGWLQYPENKPEKDVLDCSGALLFYTDGGEGSRYVRQGHYHGYHEAFFESGDEKRLPWRHTVKSFYPYPFPPTPPEKE